MRISCNFGSGTESQCDCEGYAGKSPMNAKSKCTSCGHSGKYHDDIAVTKHTPTPFQTDKTTGMIVLDSAGRVVVNCAGIAEDFKGAKILASFIVKAVNCHEELLEALKQWPYAESLEDGSKRDIAFEVARNMTQAAIEKAE